LLNVNFNKDTTVYC